MLIQATKDQYHIAPEAPKQQLRLQCQTPAMAAGLTDRAWGLSELLS
jgi:hypothetical protein